MELNVFAHAICALLLFLIWWDKPRDIQEPTLLVDEEPLDICACFLRIRPRYVGYKLIPELSGNVPTTDQCLEVSRPTTITAHRVSNDNMVVMRGLHRFEFLTVGSTHWKLKCYSYRMLDSSQQRFSGIVFPITGRELASLLRFSKALEADRSIIRLLQFAARPYGRNRTSNWTQGLFNRIPGRWSKVPSSDYAWFMAGATFAGVCYGGLHLVAWANQFPSYTESIIWRAASVTILVTGPMVAFLCVMDLLLESMFRHHHSFGRQYTIYIVKLTIQYSAYSTAVLLLLWYMLCRTFIVVECFILLAHIPESALDVPTWAAYVPSFS